MSGITLLRMALSAVLVLCLYNAAAAKAAGVEYLMVPSAAIGRAALAPWLEYYNNQRRHSALGGQPPLSRVSTTS
jgi:transposase InsO family protein